MKNFLPEIPPILEPENRLAKGLVIAFSLMVMGLLFLLLVLFIENSFLKFLLPKRL